MLAACGGSDEVAASVNGTEVPVGEVEELAGGTAEESSAAFTQSLTTIITWTITEQAAEADFGYTPSDDEVDTQIDAVLQNAGFESLEAMGESQGVTDSTLRRYIIQLMTQDAVVEGLESTVEQPTAEEIDDALATSKSSWTTVCASHILVATEEEAQAALVRINNGEDFAVLAAQMSTDTTTAVNGGDLGCSVASGYVEAFADATMSAPINVVVGPVQTEFGFHLIIVSERTEATIEEVDAALSQQAILQAADDWYLSAAEEADITVTEAYGTWVTDPTPQVLPPVTSG